MRAPPRDRRKRLREAKRRLEEELWAETRANAAYEHYRATGQMRNGRRLGAHSPPKPYTPPATPDGRISLSDPDSRVVKGLRGFIQGYDAQAVTNVIVIAAEVSQDLRDSLRRKQQSGQVVPAVPARESRYRIALLEALRDRGSYRELNTTPAVAA